VLSVFPLAVDVAQPAAYMQHSELPVGERTAAQQAFVDLVRDVEGRDESQVEALERFEFYRRVDAASLIVQSGEVTAFGNALLCKGVILP
jgi:L-fucose mutarotase